MIIGVIGTREPDETQRRLCTSIVRNLQEHTVVSGGADGIDNIALSNAKKCIVVLPWASYNRDKLVHISGTRIIYDPEIHTRWIQSVYEYHPNPSALTRGSLALHARNYGIIERAQIVIAFPSLQGGGTAQGMRIARAMGKPLFLFPPNRSYKDELHRFCEYISQVV